MFCCEKCFKDKLIKNTIKEIGLVGNCDFCASTDVKVIDSMYHSPVSEKILDLVESYEVSDNENAKPLREALVKDWDIFNVDADVVQGLVETLCHNLVEKDSPLFKERVIIPELYDRDYLNEYCIVKDKTWSYFSEHIKHYNRFHNDCFNSDAFASMISAMDRGYKAGSVFYRARFSSDSKGLTSDEMFGPPKGQRAAGRVNPEEIPVLYLSSDPKTVLYEIRSHVYDYVTIGTFELKRDISLVDLSSMDSMSPFQFEGGIERFAINRKAIQEIANEIAKPLRRSDSTLEYLPTQFIVEYIKSQKYDGVEYSSTIKTNGKNIALFDESLVECVSVQTVEVTDIEYSTDKEMIAASAEAPMSSC